MLDEKVVCTAVSLHLQVQCYFPFWQMHSDFRDFDNGVYHVVRIYCS